MNINKKTTKDVIFIVLAITSVIMFGNKTTRADFVFGTPVNLGPVVNSPDGDGCGFVSSNGLELYFSSGRPPGAPDDWDLWITTRETIDNEWSTPVHLEEPLSTQYDEWIECGSNDGLSLFIASNRPGGYGNYDIWVASRASLEENWDQVVNLGPAINSADDEFGATISGDGLTLFIARAGIGMGGDIWVSKRDTVNDDWESPVNLGQFVNGPSEEMFPCLLNSSLHLLLSDNQTPMFRENGLGGGDIWMTTRASIEEGWSIPVNLGSQINSEEWDGWPCISADGSILYFSSKRAGGLGGYWGDIWQASVEPVVDLNSDGIVDAADICIMVDNWGTDEPLCDIGPTPFGDGVVDVQDLIVLAEHLFEEFPPAEPIE